MVWWRRTPFGVDWDDLALEHVTAFLDGAPDESLTWEAKGGAIRPEHVREAVCAFANSDLGGFVLLGATQDRRTRSWTIDGWIPRDEPELWVGNSLANGGVLPRPSTAFKEWGVPTGGRLAVLAVRPVAVPPAITRDGQVWLRTSSATAQVKDPSELRKLFERGSAAESRAWTTSKAVGSELFARSPAGRVHVASLGFAAPTLPADVSANVFRESFYRRTLARLQGMAGEELPHGLRRLARAGAEIGQGSLMIWTWDGFNEAEGYTIQVGRHGGVAVAYASPDVPSGAAWTDHAPDPLWAMWRVAAAVLEDLGGVGPMHAALVATHANGPVEAARWSEVDTPGREDLDAMRRELRRALGQVAWEAEEVDAQE